VTNVLPLHKWLDVITSEYLDGFIRDGGASIKFAIPMEPGLGSKVVFEVSDIGARLNYLVVHVNASDTRVHLPQEIFFKVAEQIDWRYLSRRVIIRLMEERGYKVDGIEPDSDNSILGDIGEANALDEQFLIRELRPRLQEEIFLNRKLAKDFRVAMTYLCLAETSISGGSYEGMPLIDWLKGTNRRVSSVRHYSIYNSINRTNAMYFFESLLHWIRYVGFSGLVALMDTSRVTLLRNPRDGLRFYTRSAVMDHYELLREFIDGTDQLESCLILILSNTEFLDEETMSKGFGIYRALMTRIIDEVRDTTLVNPMSSLVRLTDSALE
jgi:hypothetical protein